MMVVMTMWLPRLACNTPGTKAQSAPKSADAKIPSGIRRKAGRPPP